MLDRKGVRIVEERSARKEPLSEKEVRGLLGRVSRVVVARGKKSIELAAGTARPDDLRGPTGNFRAPLLVRGKTLLVGFSEDALRDLVS